MLCSKHIVKRQTGRDRYSELPRAVGQGELLNLPKSNHPSIKNKSIRKQKIPKKIKINHGHLVKENENREDADKAKRPP